MSRDDVARALQRQFPGAKIQNISNPSMAQMAAEAKDTRKRDDEAKRMRDVTTGIGTYYKSIPKHVPAIPEGQAWWLTIGCLFDNRKGSSDRVGKCETPGGWCNWRYDPDVSDWIEHKCDGCGREGYQPWSSKTKGGSVGERDTWLCTKCRVKMGFLTELEANQRVTIAEQCKRRRESFTKKRLGGMEILNENIGGQMAQHGDPAVVEDLRRRGVLQVRRDENGNPCEYMVASSRREQADRIKEFNRRQQEAKARGWRGTHDLGGRTVKEVWHGGNSPS